MDVLFYWTDAVVWGVVLLVAAFWALSLYAERRERRAALDRPIPPTPAEPAKE